MNIQKKNKTIIYLIFVIILLFLIIIGAVVTSFKIDRINQKSGSELKYKFNLNGENYSKEDLIAFLESAQNCKNYSFEFTESGNLVSGAVYNKKVHYFNGYEDTYYDYTSKEMVIVSDEDKTYRVLNTDLDDKYKNILANVVLVFLKCDDSRVKFIKSENYNGFDCIVERVFIDDINKVEQLGVFTDEQIELLKKYDNQKIKISYEFWIDQQTGLLPKYDIVLESVEKKENRIEYDTNLKVDSVKEDDIIIPEETMYSGYRIIK